MVAGYKKPRGRRNTRADHGKGHRTQFEKNRLRVIRENDVCALCGLPVDKSLKYPHPLSATADHIIPVSRGGHPSDINNLQLAHFKCNRAKWDKLAGEQRRANVPEGELEEYPIEDPRAFEWSLPWDRYKANGNGNNCAELAEEMERNQAKGYILTSNGWMQKRAKI